MFFRVLGNARLREVGARRLETSSDRFAPTLAGSQVHGEAGPVLFFDLA